MKVQELMTQGVVSVAPEDSAETAARLMSRHNIGSLPVCTEDKRPAGIVTDRDIVLRCVAAGKDPACTRVQEIMTDRVVTVSPGDSDETAGAVMAREQIRRVPVAENGALVGMVSLGDLAVREACKMEAADCLCDVCACVRRR